MFGIGTTELLVIFVVALVIMGPKSLPKIARSLGKAMGEFRRVSTEMQRTINTEIEREEFEKKQEKAKEELFGDKKDKDKEGEKAEDAADKAKDVTEAAKDLADKAEEAAPASGSASLDEPEPIPDPAEKAEANAKPIVDGSKA